MWIGVQGPASAAHFLPSLLWAHPEVTSSIPLPPGGTAGRNPTESSYEGGTSTLALRHLCLIILPLGDLSLGSNSGQGCFPTLFGSNHNSLTWFLLPPPHPLPGAIILHQMVPAGARLALGRGTTPPASSPSAHSFLLPWQGFLDHRHRPEVTFLFKQRGVV